MGTQLPLPKKGAQQLSTLKPTSIGQTAGCIKMALGVEVGLSAVHIVLDGDPAPPKGAKQPASHF